MKIKSFIDCFQTKPPTDKALLPFRSKNPRPATPNNGAPMERRCHLHIPFRAWKETLAPTYGALIFALKRPTKNSEQLADMKS